MLQSLLLWKPCCNEGLWIIQPSDNVHHLTLVESSQTRPWGMVGHYYFDAAKHSDVVAVSEILRQGLLKRLRHHALADKISLIPTRWKHIALLPRAGPRWKPEDWTYQLLPEIVISDRMTFAYMSAYVTIDPWSVLASLFPALTGRSMPQ